jgi:uncharacterized metal-binding protein
MATMWLDVIEDVQAIADGSTRAKVEGALGAAAEVRESDPVVRKVREVTAAINKEGAGGWTRVKELIEFARRMGVRSLGLAFCAGLREEAAALRGILESHGFEVYGISCSVQGPCNSVGQAEVLNALGTDLNVMMGLCIGHDATFLAQAKGPVSVIAVKDRVTCHNPLAVLGCQYQRKKLIGQGA